MGAISFFFGIVYEYIWLMILLNDVLTAGGRGVGVIFIHLYFYPS